MGQYDQAVRHFSKIGDLQVGMRDYVLYYLGSSLLKEKRCDEAKEAFLDLAKNYPDSRWYSAADSQVKASESCTPLETGSISETKSDCGSIEDEKGRVDCYFGSRQYRKAKELYQILCKVNATTECLSQLSKAAARSQDFATAIGANRTLMTLYPRSRVADEAFRKIAFLYQDSGDYRQAIPLLEELEAKTKNIQEKRLVRERIGWSRFRLEDYKGAIGSLDQALEAGETPFSLYWKGRSLERLGKQEEAEQILENLVQIYGGSYYGIRAMERLRNPLHRGGLKSGYSPSPWTSLSHGIDWRVATESLEGSVGLERIHELTELGLLNDASIEVRRMRIKTGTKLPSDPKKISKRKDADEFLFQHREPRVEDSEYPLPYADVLFSAVGEGENRVIDPLLLYAMMRQESRYRESVVSPVGAIGLLQIMPWTGRRLAAEAGWPEYQPQWLYDPVTNIELAVRYVKKLWDLLGGKWYGVAASYNAGEQVVAEWVKQRQGLPEEEFIEEIPYGETRDYVKKVYTYWMAYRTIYGRE